jgi:hypothetical protein
VQTAVVSRELSEIDPLRGRIEDWRRSPSKSKAMPEPLWQQACAAARKLGTARVARALGLNYSHLKERLSPPAVSRTGEQKRQGLQPVQEAQFVELGRVGDLAPSRNAEPMVVELVAADGTRLTIRTREAGASVLAMINAFRSRP